MPRLPVDGKKVIEHRITLGTKEREIFDHISTSIRLNSIDTEVVADIMTNPQKIIQIMYSIATIAEILGVETGLPTVADIPEVVAWSKTYDANRLLQKSRLEPVLEGLVDLFRGIPNIRGGFS
jgi:hypothetical protein